MGGTAFRASYSYLNMGRDTFRHLDLYCLFYLFVTYVFMINVNLYFDIIVVFT